MISIITLNLRFGLADDGKNSWNNRKKIFPHFLNDYSTDFYSFQEANSFQIDFLQNNLPDYQFIGKKDNTPKFWQDNIIFYKKNWTCIKQDHFFLSHTPDIPSRLINSKWPRQCTMGLFEKKGVKLICLNTHFDFDENIQAQTAEFILKRMLGYPSSCPVILTGDFNATPMSKCYQIFTKNKNFPFKNTFNAPFPNTHHGFTGKGARGHIDWILYRGNIILQNSMIIKKSFKDRYISDHFALLGNWTK